MRILVRIFLLTVVAFMVAACRQTQEEEAKLILWLDIDAPSATKSDEGNVPSQGTEDAIKDLRIWVFRHDEDPNDAGEDLADDKAFSFFIPSADDQLTQYENRYHVIPLPHDIAQNKPLLDVYVIGNPDSVGQGELDINTTRGTLDALTISGTYYGVYGSDNLNEGKPTCTSVPTNGLPYTGVAKGLSMTGSYPVMRVDVVSVRKAVSKFRFVFCQLRDEAGPMIKNLQITGLTLNGVNANGDFDQSGANISATEYLFNDSAQPYKVDGYRTSAIIFEPPTSIRRYAAPEEYAFNPPDNASAREAYAREYEALINDGVNNKKVLTEAGRCYLRETDKRLSGKVDYSYEAGNQTVEGSATFKMATPGDFVRGRSWIVYVYFLREGIQFSVSWTGWTDGGEWSLTPIDPMRPS